MFLEFDNTPPISETSGSIQTRQNDEFDSPLMRRMEQQRDQEKLTRRWDEIRQQSRQPYVEPNKGITFNQLRKQNRAIQSAPVQNQTDNVRWLFITAISLFPSPKSEIKFDYLWIWIYTIPNVENYR